MRIKGLSRDRARARRIEVANRRWDLDADAARFERARDNERMLRDIRAAEALESAPDSPALSPLIFYEPLEYPYPPLEFQQAALNLILARPRR